MSAAESRYFHFHVRFFILLNTLNYLANLDQIIYRKPELIAVGILH